jgi:uncharacterized membrane protein YphA (DoxX/SURF4 family)
MDQLASAAALVLAAVFAWAGVAKLLRGDGTRSSFAALGLPAPAFLAVVVPLVEIALAVGLVLRPAIAAWAGIAVIGAFSIVIWRAIARGIDAPCSCFGTARKEPVSTNEIVRNGMLAGLAVLATAAHGAAGWPGLPQLVIVTVLAALGRVILAVADVRRGGNRIFPDMPGRA